MFLLLGAKVLMDKERTCKYEMREVGKNPMGKGGN